MRASPCSLGIGQLVAGIVHQISNPLDGLQNCLHTLGKAVAGEAHLREYVELMEDALQRIEQTAKRVQSFARPGGVQVSSTDVNQAVRSTVALLGEGYSSGVRIETDLGPMPPVRGDPYVIQEITFNLCTNAFAAMPEGGTLTIRTRHGSEPDFPGDAKVFEPVYTTRAESGGTGLGLALCRMLVSEMGGRLEASSTVGQETTFRVLLAAAPPEKNEDARGVPFAPALGRGRPPAGRRAGGKLPPSRGRARVPPDDRQPNAHGAWSPVGPGEIRDQTDRDG